MPLIRGGWDMRKKKEVKINDKLALDRTVLANERTLLAYVRTFASLVGGGIGMVAVFESSIIQITGTVAIILGVIFLIFGLRRYILVHKSINEVFEQGEDGCVSLPTDKKEDK